MKLLRRIVARRNVWLATLARLIGRRRFSAAYFERRFRVRDPWGFETRPYEAQKYDRTLASLARPRYRRALEVGCAEGVFTARLAPLVDALLAVDIADTALGRARQRLADAGHVTFRRWDVFADPSLGTFDLVVCSEVLCFAESRDALDQVVRRVVELAASGGDILLAHLRIRREHPAGWDADDLLFGADSIHAAFAALPELTPLADFVTDRYAIASFRRK